MGQAMLISWQTGARTPWLCVEAGKRSIEGPVGDSRPVTGITGMADGWLVEIYPADFRPHSRYLASASGDVAGV